MNKLDKKMKVGHPIQKHGGFSFLTKGELPKKRAYLRRYLTNVRQGLIYDLGGDNGEQELSTAKLIIIDRVISKLGVIRCIEESVKVSGVILKNNLAPCLGKSYLAYTNSIRLDFALLGIEKWSEDSSINPLDYIQGKAQDSKGK